LEARIARIVTYLIVIDFSHNLSFVHRMALLLCAKGYGFATKVLNVDERLPKQTGRITAV
jgi:hypothetical protein